MSIQIQHKIKQNALEIKEYVSDLYDWEKEMEIKEKVKTKLRQQQKIKVEQISKNSPVVPSQVIAKKQLPKQQQPQEGQKKKDLIRDKNTVGDYYKAWDKFDADEQLKKLEQQQQKKYRPYNPYEDNKSNLRAKPQTKINISGRRNVNIINDPSQLKDKGNMHFQNLQYEKAINCYTECLKRIDEQNEGMEALSQDKRKLKCVVLSNRSMTYLKIQETLKALNDANQSLVFNDKYSKSYYRRAECLKKLGKYKESLKDFKIVRRLQPTETKADAQIKRIQAFLAKRCKQTKDSMVLQYNSNLLLGSRRIQIQQTEALSQPHPHLQQKTNYLQEL